MDQRFFIGLLLGAGAVAILVGWFWLLFEAFRERVLWGLAILFVPPVGAVFLVLHWRRAGFAMAFLATAAVLLGGIWLYDPAAIGNKGGALCGSIAMAALTLGAVRRARAA